MLSPDLTFAPTSQSCRRWLPSKGPNSSPTSSLLLLQMPRLPDETLDSCSSKSGGRGGAASSSSRYMGVWKEELKQESTGELLSHNTLDEWTLFEVINGTGSPSDSLPASSRTSEGKSGKSPSSPVEDEIIFNNYASRIAAFGTLGQRCLSVWWVQVKNMCKETKGDKDSTC